MQGHDWDQIKDVFHAVRQSSATERERRLDELCGDDGALRAQVVELLEADGDGDSFLDSRLLDAEGGTPLPKAAWEGEAPIERAGDRIGPYKLLQEIGEGGFGVVYMAEQERPIRRRVALKVIKPGMDTKQVIARFEAERQALAMMDHPNIARVFDAGTTPGGRPYFVMELVKGIPITDYCDDHQLDTRERLALFVDVCRAVQHAHQAGIIHRDLKPTNVLVTMHDGVPVPKVIDFGVAKATRARLTDATLFTEFHQFIGTPSYMSPEQAAYEGLDVDARSDVYSLGVLLYELLTGTTPFDSSAMKRAAYFEVLRILREEEPPRPSTRVTTMGHGSDMHAKHRRADPAELAKQLRGDLDWIVMKALEKDRSRRYDSATDLADDIARYFELKPIVARPPSRIYRARKLLRRRRGRFAAAAVLLLAFFTDIGYASWQRAQVAELAALPEGLLEDRADLLLTSEWRDCIFEPRPSPDGKLIAYTNICMNPGVYVADVESGEAGRLVSAPDWYWGLAWAPDGTRVVTQGPKGLEVIDVRNGDVTLPAALAGLDLSPFDWSADGASLTGVHPSADGQVESVVVSMVSGDVTSLARGVRQGQASPAVSPNGRFVAFGDVAGESEDLFILDLESGERWRVTETARAENVVLWSPDGTHLAFVDDQGLWVQPVREGRPTGPARLVRKDVWPNAWEEHGFYYTVDNFLTKGYRIPVDPETGYQTGTWEPFDLPAPGLRNIRFAWAPDMSRTAMAGWSDGMIYLTEGGRVTSYPVGLEVLPRTLEWSADGSRVLYTSPPRAQRDRGLSTVMALDPRDGTTRPLFEPREGIGAIDVSPHGDRVVYRLLDGNLPVAIAVSDLDGGNEAVIARTDPRGALSPLAGQPLFSPDAAYVLYSRFDTDEEDSPMTLYVVSADGKEEHTVAQADWLRFTQWDPSGRMIVFMAGLPDRSLRIVDWRTGATHDIEGFSELSGPRLLDWSPDGRYLAVRETVGRTEVWRSSDLLGES